MLITSDPHEMPPFHGGVLVPTMGAVHDGHLSLIRHGATVADGRSPVVVTIFVNPRQFAPHEDFDAYPRDLDADAIACQMAGADVIFAPTIETIYPPDVPVWEPELPNVATAPHLEDAARPHFFGGVTTVVARLLDILQPLQLILGEKDYQQCRVIDAMVRSHLQRWPGLDVINCPTVREEDGLAMSSRNAYLDQAQRPTAATINAALTAASTCATPVEAQRVMVASLVEHGLTVDYAVVRDARTLLKLPAGASCGRALIAASIDAVRLIDNAPWHASDAS